MSAYNLKQNLNKWTNIEVSIDNTNGTVELYVNGTQQQFIAGANVSPAADSKLTIDDGKQFTKNADSKFHIGGNKNGNKEFTGKLERIEFSNKARNPVTALAKYQNLKQRDSDSTLNMQFKPSSSRDLSESSKHKSIAKFNKQNNGAILEVNDGRDAVKFKNADYIEMNVLTTMYGDKLLNSTFASWIKTPIAHHRDSYEPIISRENVFSFGLNNGHASLFLSQNNQLAPGTNVSREESSVVSVGQAISNVMEPTHENLLIDANFNTSNAKITKPELSEYSSIISGSKVVKMTTSDKIEVDKTTLIGKNVNNFTFSGWVNFSSLNDNAIIFERPDVGLALKANSSGTLNLEYKILEYIIKLSDVTNTSSAGSSSYKSSIVKAPNTTYTFLSNVNDPRMGLTTQKVYDAISFADDTVTIYMKYTTGSTSTEVGTFFHTGLDGDENYPKLEFSYTGQHTNSSYNHYSLNFNGTPNYPCEVKLQIKAPLPAINTEYEIMMTISKTQLENASVSNSNGSARVYLDGILLDDDNSKLNYVSTFTYTGNITTSGTAPKSYHDLAIPRMKDIGHNGYGDAVINQLGFFDGDIPYATMNIQSTT